jgi:hypothetical protein
MGQALAENGPADANQRRPFGNGSLQIIRHTHRQGVQRNAVTDDFVPELAQQPETGALQPDV